MTPLVENRLARHLTAGVLIYGGTAILVHWPWTVSHACHRTWHRGLLGKLAVVGLPVALLHHVTRGMRHGCIICELGRP